MALLSVGTMAPSSTAFRFNLISDEERAESWRIGGVQHLALHERSGELFSIVHKGGAGTHKDPGSDIWVYELAGKKRTLQSLPP